MTAVECKIASDWTLANQWFANDTKCTMEGSDTSACLANQSSSFVHVNIAESLVNMGMVPCGGLNSLAQHVNMIETIGEATGKATETPMPMPSQGYGEAAQQAPLYNTRVRHVRFCLELNSTHEVTAYSEVYGLHPRDFNFEKHVHPQAWCFVAPFDTESDSENDFEEEEDVEDEQPFIPRRRSNMPPPATVDEQGDQSTDTLKLHVRRPEYRHARRPAVFEAPQPPASSPDYRHAEATRHETVAIKWARPIIAHSTLCVEERLSKDDEKAFKTEALFPVHSISIELVRETFRMLADLAQSSLLPEADDVLVSPHSSRASNPTLLGSLWPRTAPEKPEAVCNN